MADPVRLVDNPPTPYPAALIGVESEFALLAALMISNDLIDRISDLLTSADFFEPAHRLIFEGMQHLAASGSSVNPLTLRDFVDGDPLFAELGGGPAYLARMFTTNSGVLIGARDFARTIADLAKRRRLRDEMLALTADLESRVDHPIEGLIDRVDGAVAGALQRDTTISSLSLAGAVDRAMQAIEDEATGVAPKRMLVEGLDDFNILTGGMRPGNFIVLAGRPGMGKTATAISLALACARAGHGTAFFSLEMKIDELAGRAISDLAFHFGNAPTYNAILAGRLNEFDRRRIADARERIERWPLVLTDPPVIKIGRLAMMIRRYQRQFAAKGQALKIVFIDYLGLIQPDKRVSRYEDISEISRSLKRIAKETDVVIIALSQLSRAVEQRENKRPQLSDLRDSGDIEQDADCVIFVYREQYYLEQSEPGADDKKRVGWEQAMESAKDRVELIAAKVRSGRIGKKNCYFFGAHQAVRGSRYMVEDPRHE